MAKLKSIPSRSQRGRRARPPRVHRGRATSAARISSNVSGIANMAAVADHFGVPLWVMLVPELPLEMVHGDGLKRLDKLVKGYIAAEPQARRRIEEVAEVPNG